MFSIDHAPKTVRSLHGFISSVLSHYAPDLKLRTNLPGKIKTSISIPTDDQIIQAIRHASGHMPLIIQIAAALGLRRAEICALTWSDLSGGMLSVNKAMAKDDDNQWLVKAPKSYSGMRSLPVPPALLHSITTAVLTTPHALC